MQVRHVVLLLAALACGEGRAAEAGVVIVCNTDAHGVDTLDNISYSVATARRAWLSAEQVANSRPWRSFAPLRKRAKHS